MCEPTAETLKLVVGLGNPGRRYEKTRHNVGFRAVDALSERWGASKRSAHEGVLYEARPNERRVLMFQPHTFMNRSGQAVVSVVNYYRLALPDVLIVLDDIALPLGRLRARASGSAGSQKGLADVLARLGTEAVPRLRIGIDAPPDHIAAEDYVLSRFAADEEAIVAEAIAQASDAVSDWITDGINAVMDRYNAATTESPDPSAEPTDPESLNPS